MTTTLASKPSNKRKRRKKLPPSLGPQVCAWIEKHLVHAEGDYFGKPFRLRSFEKLFIYNAYELNQDGSRRYSRALLGLPKGNGKTELAAALSCCELAGPVSFGGWEADGRPIGVRRLAPDIPVGAASFEQADILFGAAKTMVAEGPLKTYFDVYDTEIRPKVGPGRLYRVAAVAGTNDGRRPTFFVADEVHEWMGTKERVYLVLSNGRAKRADAWELAITTAGWDSASLLGKMYQHGKRVQTGDVDDPSFLFDWHEPEGDVDLADPEALEAAVRVANPALGDFLPLENILARAREIPDYEFRRYHLNQWVGAPERWLPPGTWEAQHTERAVPEDGTEIVLGFDGSYSGDSTAIVGATVEPTPHLFVVGLWEKRPDDKSEWRVDILDVEQTIRQSFGRWKVRWAGCDPFRWQRSIAVLADEGFPMLEWPSHNAARMVPACAQFYDAASQGRLTQDGNQQLARHIGNCVVKIDSRGPRITKDHKDSAHHIDLAVAAVIAFDLAVRAQSGEFTSWRPL